MRNKVLFMILSASCIDVHNHQMTDTMQTPVVIGVGEIVNRSSRVEDALEPRALMLQAILNAVRDTAVQPEDQRAIVNSIEGIHVVNTWTWTYHDLPDLLGKDLGVQLKYGALSEHAGNSPGVMMEHAIRRVVKGETTIDVVTGGEALASCQSTECNCLAGRFICSWFLC